VCVFAERLAQSTTYRVRAYLRSGYGLTYSDVLTFTVGEEPVAIVPQWKEVSDYGLAEGVKLYKTSAVIDGRSVNAWYAEADMSGGALELRAMKAASPMTPSSFLSSHLPSGGLQILVNGGYFGGSQSYSYVLDRGGQMAENIKSLSRTKTYNVTRGAFGVDKGQSPSVKWLYGTASDAYDLPLPVMDGAPVLEPTPSYPSERKEWDVWSAIGGGPVLLKDGRMCFDYAKSADGHWITNHELLQSDIFGDGVRAPRTAVGHTADGRIIIMVCDGRGAGGSEGLTLDALARLMRGVGCTDALNLDGGGSSMMLVGGDGTLVNIPSDGRQRNVLSFVAIMAK